MKLFSLLICLAYWSCLGFSQENDLRSLYQHAKAAEQTGDYKSATADYEKILELSPNMAEAYANAGNLYYAQGQTQKAESYFRKAIALKPTLSAPYFFLGLLDFKKRAYAEALRLLQESEKRDTANPIVQSYLGYTHYALKNYDAAAVHLEKAATDAPRDIDVFYHLSKVYAELASNDFRALRQKFPESIYSALSTAHFYEAQKNWDLALKDYTRAAAQRPGDTRLQQKIQAIKAHQPQQSTPSSSLALSDNIEGALTLFYKPPAGDRVSDSIRSYQERARRLRIGNAPSAEALYELAEGDQALSYLTAQWVFEIDPDSYRAHQIKGQYYEEAKDDDKAITEYRKAVAINAQLPNVHFLIGNLYWKREKPDDAFPELQKELQIDPNHPQALYELGDICVSRNTPAAAELYFLKAIRYEPRMQEAYLALARIYADDGHVEKAISYLNRASELRPNDPAPHYRLSRIYQQIGKQEQARAELAEFGKLRSKQAAKMP